MNGLVQTLIFLLILYLETSLLKFLWDFHMFSSSALSPTLKYTAADVVFEYTEKTLIDIDNTMY